GRSRGGRACPISKTLPATRTRKTSRACRRRCRRSNSINRAESSRMSSMGAPRCGEIYHAFRNFYPKRTLPVLSKSFESGGTQIAKVALYHSEDEHAQIDST